MDPKVGSTSKSKELRASMPLPQSMLVEASPSLKINVDVV
jgi:hypothetical protein